MRVVHRVSRQGQSQAHLAAEDAIKAAVDDYRKKHAN